jgi:four helix bundle protein
MTVMNLDKLEVWCKARDFAVTIYQKVVLFLPADEKYNLADQLKRAAVSIPANIAEGHGRYYYQDNVRFCYIARGSLTEIQSHLSIALKLKFISPETYAITSNEAESLAKAINSWIAYLKKSKTGINEPGAIYVAHELAAVHIAADPEINSSSIND